MKSICYVRTDTGNTRTRNEDAYLMDEDLGLYIVCDGVGGQASGHIASDLCVKAVRQVVFDGREVIRSYTPDSKAEHRSRIAELLRKAILVANDKIYQMSEASAIHKGMCTTVVAMISLKNYSIIGHVGDSRIYVLRNGEVHQLTEDHQFAVEMIKKGILTREQALQSPQRNVLTRAVGHQPSLLVDTLQVEIQNGDLFLMCTDGLYKYADRAELKNQLGHEPRRLPDSLIEFAKASGGNDNITALVVKMEADTVAKPQVIDVIRKTELVGKIPIFRYLSYAETMKLLSIARIRNFTQGQLMMKEDDTSEEMHIIAQGSAQVLKRGAQIAVCHKGDPIGEMGIFDNSPRSATVVALDEVITLAIPRKPLLDLLRQDSQLAVKLLWALNSELNLRLRRSTDQVFKKSEPVHGQNSTPPPFDISFP